jgi:hypothetical protein
MTMAGIFPAIFLTAHALVDEIFTTLFERLFTKSFDVNAQSAANTCVYRACNAG